MRTKDKLCRRAVELENEIEFRVEAKLPVRNEKKELKEIYKTLEEMREDDSDLTLFKAKALVEAL